MVGPAEPGDAFAAPGRRRGGWKLAALALVTLAAFVAAVWYAYDRGVRQGATFSPPLIRADHSPTKVRPKDPGGLEVPHQDKLVYETLAGDEAEEGPERLLPPPEEPLPRPEPAAAPVPEVRASGAERVVEVAPPAALPPAPEPAPSAAPAAGEPPPAPASSAAPATVTAARTAPAPAEPEPPQEAVAPGGFRVQLASYRDPEAATRGWSRLSKANPALLRELTPDVIRVDLGPEKGIFYRLTVGPLADRGAADALCAKLKERKVGCLIVKP